MNREPSLDDTSSTAATRAREILSSLKERREFFESRIAAHGHAELEHPEYVRDKNVRVTTTSTDACSTARPEIFKPLPFRGAPLFTPEESEAITRQLSWSLQERQSRLSRVSGKPRGCTLEHASKSSPDTHQQNQQYLSVRSPSNHSTHTAETVASTASPNSSPGNFSMGEPSRWHSSDDLLYSFPRPPTLDEIKESFQETKNKDENASSRSNSYADDSHHSHCGKDDLESVTTARNQHGGVADGRNDHDKVSNQDFLTAKVVASEDSLVVIESDEKKDDVASSCAHHNETVRIPQHAPLQVGRSLSLPEDMDDNDDEVKQEQIIHRRASSSGSFHSFQHASDGNVYYNLLPSRPSAAVIGQSQPRSVDDTNPIEQKSCFDEFDLHHYSIPNSLLSKGDSSSQGEFSSVRESGDGIHMQPSLSSKSSPSLSTPSTKEQGAKYLGDGKEKDICVLKSRSVEDKYDQLEQCPLTDDRNSKQLLSMSLAKDEDRKILLRILQHDDPESAEERHIRLVPISASPLTVGDDTVVISDESSFECSTDDSDTSGWDSSEDNGEDMDDASDIDVVVEEKQKREHAWRPIPSPNHENAGNSTRPHASITVYRTTGPISLLSGSLRDVTIDEVSVEEEKGDIIWEPMPREEAVKRSVLVNEMTRNPVLFVSEGFSDENCAANGGLHSLSVLSGLTASNTLPNIDMSGVSFSEGHKGYLFLSPDFRCGAHGSLYDIAVRSGCEIEPAPPKRSAEALSNEKALSDSGAETLTASAPARLQRKRKKFPARAVGGLYYIACKSGLTRDLMQAKEGYTVSARPARAPLREFDGEVVPIDISNRTCGTMGSLYLALESGMVPSSYTIRRRRR